MLRRRVFFRQIAGVAAIALLDGCAPSLNTPKFGKVRRIGYLTASLSALTQTDLDPFRETLSALGYVEGRDIVIEVRTAETIVDRLPGLVSELIRLPVDILVTGGTIATLEATKATSRLPIVFVSVTDPVAQGIVASLARPGGNVTGVSAAPSVSPKQLELLQATVPGLRRIALLSNANNAGAALQLRDTEDAARTLGLELQVFAVRNPDELDVALESIARSRPDALLVGNAFNLYRELGQIPDFAAKMRLPQIYGTDAAFVRFGGLMALGANRPPIFRRAAQLVDKILKGANPADLPVELPTEIDFIVNLPAAQRIGLTIPDSVLRQATEVIR